MFVIFVLLFWSQNHCLLHQECKKNAAVCFISGMLFLFHHVIYDQLCTNILCMEWNEFRVPALIWISVVQQYCYECFLSIGSTGALVRSWLTELETWLAPVLCSQWGPPAELQPGRNPHWWGKLPLRWGLSNSRAFCVSPHRTITIAILYSLHFGARIRIRFPS